MLFGVSVWSLKVSCDPHHNNIDHIFSRVLLFGPLTLPPCSAVVHLNLPHIIWWNVFLQLLPIALKQLTKILLAPVEFRGWRSVERGRQPVVPTSKHTDKYWRLLLWAKLLVNNPQECHCGVFRV